MASVGSLPKASFSPLVSRRTSQSSKRSCGTSYANRATSAKAQYSTASAELLQYGKDHLAQGTGKMAQVLIERGEGSYLFDMDGRKYLDFSCGIAVTNTGHCHPRVVKAAQEQTAKIIHAQVAIMYQKPMIELTKRLLHHLPKPIDRVFYANSGAEAIENAVKIARQYTKKPNVIVMENSFHGRTNATMAMTTSKTNYKLNMGPLMAGVNVVPFPYCYRCPVKNSPTQPASVQNDPNFCCGMCEEKLEDLLHMQADPKETAAIVLEPIQGEGGYVPVTKQFFQKLRKVCTDNNILLVADEVQTGFLRTGKWWGFEHFDVVPDLVVMAKGIASGFPLSAVAGSDKIMKEIVPGSIGGTYTGNAVACAAAVATIDVLEQENIQENVAKRSEELVAGLKLLQLNKNYHIGDVRGKGLMIGIEFDRTAPKGIAGMMTKQCVADGMFILGAGAFESIRFIPPLTANKSEIQEGLAIFKKALDKCFKL